MSWRNYDQYPKSKPVRKEGGIKAKAGSKLGGERWWAKRWIAVLERFDLGARLSRGRSYARSGQVRAIEISAGVVAAKVQGSRATPYKVAINLAPLSPEEWDSVMGELSGRAIFLAKLLAGEMPTEIEEVFQSAKVPLFPATSRDLTTDCSCPDWSNPCKHIAAVFYLLGEEFDRDPFLIFTLRGLSREALLDRLRTVAGTTSPTAAEQEIIPEPLSNNIAMFWSGTPMPENFTSDIHPSAVTAPLLRRLGYLPFWRGAEPVLLALTPAYEEASQRGRDCCLRLSTEVDVISANES